MQRQLEPTGILTGESRVRDVLRRVNRVVERSEIEWLVYNPLKMWQFHKFAQHDAPSVVSALESCIPGARRIVDVGAGSGALAAEAHRRGHRVLALERNAFGRLLARRQGVASGKFDLGDDPPAVTEGPYDLAICIEVAEHIPPAFSPTLVGFLSRLAPTIVFTAAPPGQGGTGHINERPVEEWIELFARHGVSHDGEATDGLRAAFRAQGVWAPWLHDNVNVLRQSA